YAEDHCLAGKFGWFETAPTSVCADNGNAPVPCLITNPDGSTTVDPDKKCCLLPTTRWNEPNCLNSATNRSIFVPSGVDARFFNLAVHAGPNGETPVDGSARPLTAAYFRLYSDRASSCREPSSGAQLGCITDSDPASLSLR